MHDIILTNYTISFESFLNYFYDDINKPSTKPSGGALLSAHLSAWLRTTCNIASVQNLQHQTLSPSSALCKTPRMAGYTIFSIHGSPTKTRGGERGVGHSFLRSLIYLQIRQSLQIWSWRVTKQSKTPTICTLTNQEQN